MKGTRPLDNDEIRLVSACFTGTYEVRNRGLFMLGVSTGGRISELLSLTIGDVYQNRAAVTDLLFDKSIVKGGEISRAVPVNSDGRRAIEDLITWHREKYGKLNVKRPLFPSRNGQGEKRMSRRTAHDVLKAAFEAAGLNGKLATHSLRKSFAQRLYDQTGDVFCCAGDCWAINPSRRPRNTWALITPPSAMHYRKCRSMLNCTKGGF